MPDSFRAALKTSELPPGEMKWVAVDRRRLLVANVEGQFYALDDICGHQRVPLSSGTLDGHIVECPLHFARYDLRTGQLVDGPTAENVAAYEVRVEGDTVFVKV
ncbi:MAG TPA: non-heme iron oxygenase ferredoxin subunit [Stellaceae bacterium]|nr:non-heme iron oxygenase ferredoxin subunit [Stellaceae bacterium]